MTIQVELNAEMETQLAAEARARGMALEQYAQRLLEDAISSRPREVPAPARRNSAHFWTLLPTKLRMFRSCALRSSLARRFTASTTNGRFVLACGYQCAFAGWYSPIALSTERCGNAPMFYGRGAPIFSIRFKTWRNSGTSALAPRSATASGSQSGNGSTRQPDRIQIHFGSRQRSNLPRMAENRRRRGRVGHSGPRCEAGCCDARTWDRTSVDAQRRRLSPI